MSTPKGINKYDQKERRLQRRRNHIARDLAGAKYRQRVVPSGRRIKRIEGSNDEVFYEDVRYDEEE